ncbi:MAG: hypothetical protein HY975_03290 [Candidatus Kerfeldbacteria bacterium]|nr:hypothetical protein [Candidatus Kerfeldbacteria bacterium]
MARDEQITLAQGERQQRIRTQRNEFDASRERRQQDQVANRQARTTAPNLPDQSTREREWSKQLDRTRVANLSAGRRPSAQRDYGRMGNDLRQSSPSAKLENAQDAISRIGSFNNDTTQFARAARYGELRGLRGVSGKGAAGAAAVAMEEAKAFVEQAYKRVWQAAQEGVEDVALSFADFFLFSGPATIILYFTRWIGGNVMGGMLRKNITPPPPYNALVPSIDVQLVPSYSTSDPLDLIRHAKLFIIGGITVVIYGFIVMLLYMVTHPSQVAQVAGLQIWQAIIAPFQAIIDLFTAANS